MTKILTDDRFESLRLLEEQSQSNQLAVERMKKIFGRLFQGTEVNPDDFYFTVFDDEHSNAFFIEKQSTLERKKNLIAVSRGLIAECQTEAELAGIMGHECGHYLWGELLKGNNSIFQEHGVDLYAIDLLRNGGYNPREHLEICKRILGNYGKVRYSDVTIDVHGNGLARIDNIQDYMTYIASNEGDFPPLAGGDADYEKFKGSFKQAFEGEGYDTYIEKCFKREFGTKKMDKISAQDALQVMLKEMQEGNITIDKTTRFQEMFSIVRQYSRNGDFNAKTSELTELCQNFFMETHKQIEDKDAAKKLQDEVGIGFLDSYLKGMRSNNYGMLSGFRLNKFGDFLTQYDNIEHFVNYKDKQDAIHWAEEMYKLNWTLDYAHAFADGGYPYLKAKNEENVGKMLPWKELRQFVDEEKNPALTWAVSKTTYDKYAQPGDYYSRETDDRDYKEKIYFLDENGIVLAYGDEALKMNEDSELAKKNRDFLFGCQSSRLDIERRINFYNLLASFDRAEDSAEKDTYAQEFLKLIGEYGYKDTKFPLIYAPRNPNPSNLRNPEIEKIQEIYYNSPTYQYFVSEQDEPVRALQKEIKQSIRDKFVEQYKRNHTDDNESDFQKFIAVLDDEDVIRDIQNISNIEANIYQKEKICSAIYNLANYFQKKGDDDTVFKLYVFASSHVAEGFSIDNATSKISDSEEYKVLREQYEERSKKLEENLYQRMVTSPTTIDYLIRKGMNDYSTFDLRVLEQLKDDNLSSSPLLEKAMKTMGFDASEPLSESFARLDDYIGKNVKMRTGYRDNYNREILEDIAIDRSLYDEKYLNVRNVEDSQPCYPLINFYRNAGILIFANNIKRGNDWDLKETMKYLRVSVPSSQYAPLIPDMIAESIQKGDKFNKLSLEDKIYVYEVMEELKLFSEKHANKNEYFKAITKEIINSPDHDKAMEYAEKFLSKQYVEADFVERKSYEIEFAREKDLLVKFYAKGKSDELGIDDGSDEFLKKATACADEVAGEITLLGWNAKPQKDKEAKFSRDTLKAILNEISNNVVSQELSAQMFADKSVVQFEGKEAEKYDIYARGALALVNALAKSPDHAKVLVDFLSSKCTDKSMEKVFDSLPEGHDLRRGEQVNFKDNDLGVNFSHNFVFDKASLRMLHENFWAANLPARAFITKRILNAYTSRERTKEEKDKKKLDLVVDMFFDKKSPYYKDAKMVTSAIFANLQDYEQDLILGALVAANQKDDDGKMAGGEAIGEGLKMFFENKGPAFVKFGQMLSYLPQLDPDIRRPLAKLRDKADLPTRDVLFDLMKETLPKEELAKISRVDKILGAGSFFITVKVKYDDKDCAIAIMRPFAKELSESGMNMINNTIACLAKQASKFKPLQNIAYQAKISAESETDIDADYKKYLEAIKIYDDVKITTKSGEFTPKVAKWESYGAGKDGKVYKIMNMATGQAMTSSKMSEQQKHDAAVAYVTLELCNLLSGARWDTDRHQGQQNFDAAGEHEDGFKKFVIGIFDTGAQIQHDPDKKDKILLGEMLYGMARAARLGRNMSDYMVSKVKRIDKLGKMLNINTLYIDEVQRGLTALSDIITYQKEKKDENGKVIQEEKSLSGKEIGEIVNSILESGMVDQILMRTIKVKAVLNKLRPLRKGWISSLSEGLKKIAPTIKIEKNESAEKGAHAVARKDKPEKEILECQEKEKGKRVLGVDTKHIRKHDEKEASSGELGDHKNMIFRRMHQRLVKQKV